MATKIKKTFFTSIIIDRIVARRLTGHVCGEEQHVADGTTTLRGHRLRLDVRHIPRERTHHHQVRYGRRVA